VVISCVISCLFYKCRSRKRTPVNVDVQIKSKENLSVRVQSRPATAEPAAECANLIVDDYDMCE
jgi:hypothetical protein